MFKTIREDKTDYSYNTCRHPKLLKEELKLGCKLGLDSWAGTDVCWKASPCGGVCARENGDG